MAKPTDITDDQFEQEVLKSSKPVLVDFWATGCRPCTMIAPLLDELAEEYNDRINFARMDVEQNGKTATQYKIMSIPTLLIFKGGEPIANITGFRPKDELKQSLDAALA